MITQEELNKRVGEKHRYIDRIHELLKPIELIDRTEWISEFTNEQLIEIGHAARELHDVFVKHRRVAGNAKPIHR